VVAAAIEAYTLVNGETHSSVARETQYQALEGVLSHLLPDTRNFNLFLSLSYSEETQLV